LAWSIAVTTVAVGQEPRRLGLTEALALAAERHPGVLAARAEREARDADALAGSAAFLPTVSAELGGIRTDDPVAAFGMKLRQRRFGAADFALDALNTPAPITDVSTVLSAQQPLFQPEALFGRRAARASARAGRFAETRAAQAAAFDVIRAYFGARLADDRVRVLQESLDAARETLRQVERLRAEGMVTVVDAQLAQSRVSELAASLAAAAAARTASADLLLELLGADPGQEVVLADSLVLPTRAAGDTAGGPRPDVAALREAVAAAAAAVGRARGQWLPSLGAFGELRWHDDAIGLGAGARRWTAGIVVRWTPFAGMRDVGALRRALAERDGAQAQLARAERHARAEVRASSAEWEAAVAGYHAAEAALMQSTLAARAAAARYDAGAAVISELLAIRAAESSQRLARLQALYQARVADAALALARGGMPR